MDATNNQTSGSSPTFDSSEFSHTPPSNTWSQLAKLGLGALGVVYGDIGTSPLYSIKECFFLNQDKWKEAEKLREQGGTLIKLALSQENIFGILSLVFWSLTLVIILKYITFIMRADNHGEGGILALLALIKPHKPEITKNKKRLAILVGLGLFGAALLYGDGVITPAISVLSAVEGLENAPGLKDKIPTIAIVIITIIILIGLFTVQKRGTHRVGFIFGPVMMIWFFTIALLGTIQIFHHPEILKALNPSYAISFFRHNGITGFLVLGSVVLCITGGEALYADMGHFGRKPIRFAWYAIVFPALLLNYLGQGALLLSYLPQQHLGDKNPFFVLASGIWVYPLVAIATIATVVASQALISGAYSLTQQAIQLGYLPRLSIVHTSGEAQGQIYVPQINSMLMIACIALVVGFKKSENLAAAYGLAVTGTMGITSILFYILARHRWQWSRLRAGSLVALFLLIDGAFFGANVAKIAEGGWFPLVVAISIFAIMTTWKIGKEVIAKSEESATLPLEMLLKDIESYPLHRVLGTAVFMTPPYQEVPAVLLHHIKHNKVLHEQVILLTILTERVPEVPPEKRIELTPHRAGFYQLLAHYGFMQTPHVAEILKLCHEKGLKISLNETSFYLGRETLRNTGRSRLTRWRKILFSFLTRNARPATEFFGIPPNRVVELGAQIEV